MRRHLTVLERPRATFRRGATLLVVIVGVPTPIRTCYIYVLSNGQFFNPNSQRDRPATTPPRLTRPGRSPPTTTTPIQFPIQCPSQPPSATNPPPSLPTPLLALLCEPRGRRGLGFGFGFGFEFEFGGGGGGGGGDEAGAA
ncbi:hypothetical protein B0H17DRAFT_551430 [Mycena rosella]|uniref:Uncharacterized protein n=1 Tax=Mycena rosella TaxID=1033263 RepID=A0AAD7DJY8_MYCRO|nr:hypothetical protein B0H17DRAFT_551430 [Mycena rosella]